MPALRLASLPSQCLICRAWPSATLCAACIARFAAPRQRCARCAEPVPDGTLHCGTCLTTPPPLDHCAAAVGYEWPWNLCLQRFKFQHDVGLARPLAELMRSNNAIRELIASVDWILPIPASANRMAERGFNPPALLARRLAGRARCRNDILVRQADPPPQRGLDRVGRQRNIRGAFGVAPYRAALLRGRGVALIDDVMTTGATLHEAARVLRRAGAARVLGVVLARD